MLGSGLFAFVDLLVTMKSGVKEEVARRWSLLLRLKLSLKLKIRNEDELFLKEVIGCTQVLL